MRHTHFTQMILGELLPARGRSAHHHRHKIHSGKKLLAAAARNMITVDTSAVQVMDNEESSVGSPSETVGRICLHWIFPR